MDAKIFRVNYKSDFILTLTSDAGWMTPFCIKFWTGSPMLAYYASYDGETYTHCTYDPSEPTKLTVQFDDHHLPIGNLKYQVAYHFTVADFPENTEDEVTNQANVTTVIDGDTYQVMLDLNGETAPEIQFALPAYANELQRIQNEQTRIAQEQQRIAQEQQRISQEAARVTEFNGIKAEASADHTRANEDHSRATSDHQNALAERSQAASDHSRAQSDHSTADSDHLQASSDHSRAQSDHNTALSDHQTALSDHTQANTDHTRAESDHTRATADSSTAAADHRTASTDHTQANTDHARAESDHQRVETDLAEVEEFSNSLGAYDISAANATGSTLATYPDIATALGPNGSNIPEALRKGGMSVKFVLTYDNKYVQYRYLLSVVTAYDFVQTYNWQGVTEELAFNSKDLPTSDTVEKGFWVGEPDSEIDLSEYEELSCYINSSTNPHTWVNTENYKCKVIPITAGNRYVIKNEGSYSIDYALLRTDNHAGSGYRMVYYATGYNKPVSVTAGDENIILAPANAAYLFISTFITPNVVSPSVAVYNKHDIRVMDSTPTDGSKNPIESGGVHNSIQGLNTSIQNLNTKETNDVFNLNKKLSFVTQNAITNHVRHTVTIAQALWTGLTLFAGKTYEIEVETSTPLSVGVTFSVRNSSGTVIGEGILAANTTSVKFTATSQETDTGCYIRVSGTPINEYDITITPTKYIGEEIIDGSVTGAKLADYTIPTTKLNKGITSKFDTPFSYGLSDTDVYNCIRDIKIYTTNVSLLSSIFSVKRLRRSDSGDFWLYVQKDGVNYEYIELANFTPYLDSDHFVIRKDSTTYIEVDIKWALIPVGTDVQVTHIIKPENIIFRNDLNNIVVWTQRNVHPCVVEAIKEASVRCLDNNDVNANYYLYSFRKIEQNGALRFQMRLVKSIGGKTWNADIDRELTTGNEVITFQAQNVSFKVNCSVIPVGTNIQNYQFAYIVNRLPIEPANARGSYLGVDTVDYQKDVVYVDCRRSSSSGIYFKTIKEACEYIYSISPKKPQQQYQIVVNPGVYDEMGIKVPPYTHIHGAIKDSVIVTDRSYIGQTISSCLFDFGTNADVAWKTPAVQGKISNMTLLSVAGSYCIHANDVGGIIAIFENVYFKFVKPANRDIYFVCGAGGNATGYLIKYNGCIFQSIGGNKMGEIGGHNSEGQSYGNVNQIFKDCQFINCFCTFQHLGAYGKYNVEFDNCKFDKKGYFTLTDENVSNNAITYLARQTMWNVIGGNNKNLVLRLPATGKAVMIEADSANQGDTIYISGSIVDAIFGSVDYHTGGTRLKAKAVGIFHVQDAQVSGQDVFQMWKRLGDCSVTNKTMSVILNNGTEQVVTLTGNYTSTKPTEASIMAEINAQLTGCSIKKVDITDKYSVVNTTEKEMIICNSANDILKYSCVTEGGTLCVASSTDVYGICLADTAYGDLMPVWIGKGLYLNLPNGNYAVGSDGQLTASDSNVVGYSQDGIFYLNGKY